MTIKTKFDLGEDVYVIKREKIDTSYECNICEGKGLIYFKGEKLECPKCSGSGSVGILDNDMYEWRVKFTEVYRVAPAITKGGQLNKYSVLCDFGYVILEDYIYKTEEDAIIECQKMNKIEIKKTKEKGDLNYERKGGKRNEDLF